MDFGILGGGGAGRGGFGVFQVSGFLGFGVWGVSGFRVWGLRCVSASLKQVIEGFWAFFSVLFFVLAVPGFFGLKDS